jgi:dienelactone hydrolase
VYYRGFSGAEGTLATCRMRIPSASNRARAWHCSVAGWLLALMLAGCGAPPPRLVAPPIWGALEPGAHWVGFTVGHLTDASRPIADGRPRPMQISIWYPADPAPDVQPYRYRDYVALQASELLAREPTAEEIDRTLTAHRALLKERLGLQPAGVDELLGAVMAARHAVPSAPGPFPLVLFAQGNGNPPDSMSVLCEYLASRGLVVMTMASQSRITGFPKTDADVLPKAEEQAADLAFIAAHAVELSPAPTREIGVVGYSFGGRGAFVYQLQSHAASAFVSLDSGIANAQGKDWINTASYFRPEAFTIPLLHVHQPGDQVVTPDFSLIESLTKSDRYLVKLTGLSHGDFTNLGAFGGLGEAFESLNPPDRSPQPAFETAVRFTEAFLRARLGGDPSAFDLLVRAGSTGVVADLRKLPAAR